ncbi:MAG: DUF2281 domain-containing protein [Candidatus Sericytochromatia bacterium]
MATRDELHQFIDTLPEGLVGEVLDFAQFVAKKAQAEHVARVMAAMQVLPEDDEPLTEDELRRIAQAEAEPGRVTRAEIRAKYGL